MKAIEEQFFLNKTYQFLLVSLAFLLPLTVFGANLIIVIIVILWLFSGNYKSKYNQIISSKFLISSAIFYCLHIVGLLWTSDLRWGFEILHKMWYFILLLPVLFTIVEKKYIKYYISSFLLAMTISELVSYLIWFEIISPFKMASVGNPVPFMSHVSYNPILAFAIYLVLHEIFFNKSLHTFKFFLYSFFALTMTVNMFITGGRAGQIMFFVMISILVFQFFNSEKIKSLIILIFLIPAIIFTAYKSSDLFEQRVNSAINDVVTYEVNSNTSVGKRIDYMINSIDIIKQHPFIGVGTGDFPTEFTKISIINNNHDNMRNTNPHNMYNLILIQLGFMGLFSFLSIFYYQIKQSFASNKGFLRDVGITLPLLFLVIMFSESYLLGHYTTLLYIFFSSFLYKDFEKSK